MSYNKTILDESLFEDIQEKRLEEDNHEDTEDLRGPEGKDYGIAELINQAMIDELDTISFYNSLAITARTEGFEDIANVIEDINTEENRHLGQLQSALKTLAPNAEAIELGEKEGDKQLEEVATEGNVELPPDDLLD